MVLIESGIGGWLFQKTVQWLWKFNSKIENKNGQCVYSCDCDCIIQVWDFIVVNQVHCSIRRWYRIGALVPISMS